MTKSLAFVLALLPIAAHAQAGAAPLSGILQGIEQAQRLSQPYYVPPSYGGTVAPPYAYIPSPYTPYPALQTTTCSMIGRDWVCRAY